METKFAYFSQQQKTRALLCLINKQKPETKQIKQTPKINNK